MTGDRKYRDACRMAGECPSHIYYGSEVYYCELGFNHMEAGEYIGAGHLAKVAEPHSLLEWHESVPHDQEPQDWDW